MTEREITLPVMEIERFAIHDGPGIRSVVFMQGCPLHCPWCANPESQTPGPKILYDKNKCVRCHTCLKNCPEHLITFDGHRMQFERNKCTGCRICQNYCPAKAINIIGKQYSISEIFDVLKRDRVYYEESNGGITFSGGEPFYQKENLIKMLVMAKKEYHFHTAIETCGATDYRWIEEGEPYIDCFLFDVKYVDPVKLSNIVRGDGERILANFRRLAESHGDKMTARVPCIPGYNYLEIRNIIDFIAESKVSRVNLLPYHTLGIGKYDNLDRSYELKGIPSMKASELNEICEYGRKLGLSITIGG